MKVVGKPGTATDSRVWNWLAVSKIEKPGDSLHSALSATVNADCRLSPAFRFSSPRMAIRFAPAITL